VRGSTARSDRAALTPAGAGVQCATLYVYVAAAVARGVVGWMVMRAPGARAAWRRRGRRRARGRAGAGAVVGVGSGESPMEEAMGMLLLVPLVPGLVRRREGLLPVMTLLLLLLLSGGR
jgi:hypothetical protein